MPNITAAGTYTKDTPGFEMLRSTSSQRAFLFGGSSYGSSCTIGYLDDTGTAQVFGNGSITENVSKKIPANINIQIVVAGSPNFNLTVV